MGADQRYIIILLFIIVALCFAGVDRERLMTIQGASTHDCQPFENPLCYVSRYAGDAASGSLCPRKLFLGSTIQELSSFCVLSCTPGGVPLISKVDELTYVLTHVTGVVRLSCRHGANKTIDLDEQKLGAVEIKVACDCKLMIDSQVLISETYPCQKLPMESEAVHIIPAAWSKLKSLKLSSQHSHAASTFDTVEECVDEMWPTQVPHWNLSFTERKRQHLQEPKLSFYGSSYEVYTTASYVIHVVYLLIVSLIVIRNPYLIGLGTAVPVRADSGDIGFMAEKLILDIIICIITLICIVSFCMGANKVWRMWRAKRASCEVAMTAKRDVAEDDGLPRNLPITEVDGKELRITLEWWDPITQT